MKINRKKKNQPQTSNAKFVTKKCFHVDGSIDRSVNSLMQNCGLINILTHMREGAVPNTYACGSIQIDIALSTLGLSDNVADVGLLDRSVLQNNQSGIFVDLKI
jgi:hypothetical protein